MKKYYILLGVIVHPVTDEVEIVLSIKSSSLTNLALLSSAEIVATVLEDSSITLNNFVPLLNNDSPLIKSKVTSL